MPTGDLPIQPRLHADANVSFRCHKELEFLARDLLTFEHRIRARRELGVTN